MHFMALAIVGLVRMVLLFSELLVLFIVAAAVFPGLALDWADRQGTAKRKAKMLVP
jgi:hypothetical protein